MGDRTLEIEVTTGPRRRRISTGAAIANIASPADRQPDAVERSRAILKTWLPPAAGQAASREWAERPAALSPRKECAPLDRCRTFRPWSAIGYITPSDKLAGREEKIWALRDQRLERARDQSRRNRLQNRQAA